MEWLDWARGPMFRFSIALMVLGLLRLLLITGIHIVVVLLRAHHHKVPWASVSGRTLRWLFPGKMVRPQLGFAGVSFVFHFAAIVTPIFLFDHIRLWKRGVGLSWPAMPQTSADILTLVAIATAAILFFRRLAPGSTRALSHAQDYFLPILIIIPFISGFLAMHPGFNPFHYRATMLVHVMSGNVLLALLPFTKLSHVVLFPLSQLLSETGWYLSPHAGQRVAITLGKDENAI